MCKYFSISLGLVTALAVALLCNVYLIFLLWSGDKRDPYRYEFTSVKFRSPDEIIIPSIKISNSGLSLINLTSFLNNTTQRSSNTFSRSSSLKNLMNKLERELRPRGQQEPHVIINSSLKWVSPGSLVPHFTPELGDVMNYLKMSPIIRASVPRVGTQLKIMVTLEGGQKALLKPQWYNRSTLIDGSVYSGADRHNGEIVAFYLSLLLNLRRTPVAVGRRVNVPREILAKADRDLAATFFKNQSRHCFYGVCGYCKPELSVCSGDDDLIETAAILWLPSDVKLKSNRSPWQRTYRKNVKAAWETDDNFCHSLQQQNRIFQIGPLKRRLLDLVDASVFDFLISNGDRHHYEMIDGSADAAVLLLDNGKSFGRPDVDYIDILAPLYQCCVIRKSTYTRLAMVESGPLGSLIEELTLKDELHPLLTDEHIQAINRRLAVVMQTIELCAKVKSWDHVLVPY